MKLQIYDLNTHCFVPQSLKVYEILQFLLFGHFVEQERLT